MNLLKQMTNKPKQKVSIVRENDATAAGDVAGAFAPLMGANTMIKRINDATIKKSVKKKTKKSVKENDGQTTLGLLDAYKKIVAEGGESEFDQSAVISKLKSLEDKEKVDVRDTVTFGIQDDNEQVVRVTIRAEQAEEFEKALQAVMAEMDEDENSKTEIAEVLFKLKDNFDIVNVVWPEIEEDEEVDPQQFGDEQGEPGMEGDGLEGLEGEPGMEGDDIGGDIGGGDEEVKGLLSQVIDMMKADAAARKADAEARIADAKAREQELGAKQAMAKIKQEEQFLDMEDYEKKQKAQEKEAKRLAQLARWKHEMGGSGYTDATADDGPEMGLPAEKGPISGYEENEERVRPSSRMAVHDLARRVLGRKQ